MTIYSTIIGKGKDARILTKRKAGLSRRMKEKYPHLVEEETTEKKKPPIIAPKEKPKELEPIRLEPKKTGIAAYREKKGFLPGLTKVMTSPLTTAVLGTTLVSLLTFGGGAAAGGRAVITRTATQLFGKRMSMTTQRAFIGKGTASGVNKIFHITRPIATRFATNAKSIALTNSLLSRVVTNPAFIIGAIGSYPFAYFIKEEALQTLNIAIFKATEAGDFEGANKLIKNVDEMVVNQGEILGWIPYVNVLDKLIGKKGFFSMAALANEEWKRVIAIKEAELSGEKETPFAKQRRTVDEAARERELAEREEDEEYWEDIQKEKEERERKASERDIKEMAWKAEYYNLIREKRYAEAEELLRSKS